MTIETLIINYPKHYEIKKLMIEHNLKSADFSNEMLSDIEDSIFAIRQTHGFFEARLFKPIIRLLNNYWLPDDMPVILPSPSISYLNFNASISFL